MAAKEKKIQGIYIRMYPFEASISQLEELRKALKEFKKSGKWIYVYADNYFQNDYYLASVADKVILNPNGLLLWKGLSLQVNFYKKLLEKLDIEVQVFRHGKFKSAVEPFILDKMSEENRQQLRTLVSSVWNDVLNHVSENRRISKEKLNEWADNLSIKDAEAAYQNKMIDLLADEKSVEEMIQKQVDTEDKNIYVNYHKYKLIAEEKYDKNVSDKIAIIYLVGQIIDYKNNSTEDAIVPSEVLKILKDVEKDKDVRAVVLRVNSPGGSGFASEVIWQAIKKLKQKKPLVVSFGTLAASGGYYISCGADYIFTDHNTITGSIGVFGMLYNIQNLMEKNLGISTDTVKTNKYADFISIVRPVQQKEHEAIMHNIQKVYDRFLSHVSEGRKLNKKYVDSIGQGRVWSGADAVKLNLADETGTLEEAIAYAAKKVNIKKYDVEEYPKKKDPIKQIMESFNNKEEAFQEKVMKASFGKYYNDVWTLKKSLENQQIQYLTLLPYQINVN